MQYTKTPSIINELIFRIIAKTTVEGYVSTTYKLTMLKPVTWFNLPEQFNKIISVIKEYQVEADDSELQVLIDKIGVFYWFNYFKKVSLLVKIVEQIEKL